MEINIIQEEQAVMMAKFEKGGTSYIYMNHAPATNLSYFLILIHKIHFISVRKPVLSPSYNKNNTVAKNLNQISQ